jgi:hypothetical protein
MLGRAVAKSPTPGLRKMKEVCFGWRSHPKHTDSIFSPFPGDGKKTVLGGRHGAGSDSYGREAGTGDFFPNQNLPEIALIAYIKGVTSWKTFVIIKVTGAVTGTALIQTLFFTVT